MNAFDFLDIKADFRNAELAEKVEQPRGVIQAVISQYSEHVKGYFVSLKCFNPFQDAIECTPSASVTSKLIVYICRSIQADADSDAVSLEEFTPFIVDQNTVCLNSVLDFYRSRRERADQLEGIPVVSGRNYQWLAGVPANSEDFPQPTGCH
jgi:hypothetical protein